MVSGGTGGMSRPGPAIEDTRLGTPRAKGPMPVYVDPACLAAAVAVDRFLAVVRLDRHLDILPDHLADEFDALERELQASGIRDQGSEGARYLIPDPCLLSSGA
jgi:hypothetical protein